MNAQRWQEIQASFDAIVELDPTEQANRLASLGTSDPELQRAIQSLLRADTEPSVRFAPYDAAPRTESESQPDLLGIAGHTIAQFDVHEVLGAGGMGIVYRADDTRLGRAVALKFLLPHYNLDPSAKTRFLREARAVAALDHPNLCTVHEVGTTDAGWLFLAMSLYQGETLRARLTREGRIGVSEALEIARQVGEGLQAAHTAGIVHRDLKPGNIMLLPDGSVRILDFGLAKARDQSVTDGSAFGTLSYMSPEQIRGDNVDGRADLWALGVVLYEMLAGRKPFGRDEEVASALAILHDVPILLTTQRVEISSALEGLVLRLLQKDPAKRYADAGEFLLYLDRVGTHVDGVVGHLQTRWRRVRRTLTGTLRPATRRVLFGAGTVATLALAYLVIPLVRAQPASTSDATDSSRSIAVLPFDNVGGDSTNLPFSDGFADELTTALGKVSRLSVMARTSAFTLKKKGLDAREIGRQLHVQFIVAGSVRRVANRRRVTASLLDVKSGKEVWSEDFLNNALNRDVFAVQDSITRSIVRQLLPRISPAVVASSANRSTENSEAHDLYLQGRYFFEKRDSVGLAKALEYFERAIRADTSYALAYSGLADAYAMQATFGFAKAKVNFPKAKEYAAIAMAHDSTLVEVHTSLAFISVFYDFDWPAARKEFDKALRLSDRYAPTHLYHAWYFL
ncbi:MAG TPA: protein kinase, partial [Gemmatimonadaceae bacterium]|nr:protein kinase [Gemmatimonadaceae bacterium]